MKTAFSFKKFTTWKQKILQLAFNTVQKCSATSSQVPENSSVIHDIVFHKKERKKNGLAIPSPEEMLLVFRRNLESEEEESKVAYLKED